MEFWLAWVAPALQSLIHGELWARIQSTQVDSHTPPMEVDALYFHIGITSEFIRGVEIERVYSLRRSKLHALLLEGLNVDWEKMIVHIGYLEYGEG